ncbi:50S ribosomal protein L15e, partial [Sulfolobus sp. A20-N-F8]
MALSMYHHVENTWQSDEWKKSVIRQRL